MTDLVRTDVVYAEANWGRWICPCPSPYCLSALKVYPDETVFRCWDCGTTADIVWPPNAADIETLLMMRPDEKTRNWLPGETLHDLLAENMAHGIVPPQWRELEDSQAVLRIAGDRIVAGVLPSHQRLSINSAPA